MAYFSLTLFANNRRVPNVPGHPEAWSPRDILEPSKPFGNPKPESQTQRVGSKLTFSLSGKVGTRLPGKGNSKLPGHEAGSPDHLDEKVDSDQ